MSTARCAGLTFYPAMRVKILICAYATGAFISRKIAQKFHEDVAFRVLAAENFPAHRTILVRCGNFPRALAKTYS